MKRASRAASSIVGMEAGTHTLSGLARAAGDGLVEITGDADARVSGLAYDSRAIAGGELFFCVPGARSDGHDFAPAAIASGATALCVERRLHLGVPEVVVRASRKAMALMAAAYFGHPAADLTVLGVTGTNGKTTTAYLLESILAATGHTTGLIGTIETRVGEAARPGVRTTPESLDLQRLLAEMRAHGVTAVAMEVTSHALALGRVEGMRFSAAVFTNLSQDHLDFHAGMDDYFAAKRSLFLPERVERGAVNVDDPYGRRLREEAGVPLLGFGLASDAEVQARDVGVEPSGSRFVVVTPNGEINVATPLAGGFNVSNCLAACACALQAGVAPDAIQLGIASVRAVPGRFESIEHGQPFAVVVDYAHTPDSLDNVLREARRMAAARRGGRVLAVFGCGGDRDRGKRPLMGTVAARLADVVVVTSDNPRSEDPDAIIGEILEGVVAERPGGADEVIADRREAIHRVLALARPNDVVIVAGKGHETGQQFAEVTLAFDDREVAGSALDELGWESRA
ncbi:MAG: UDP-N-acetylmuramoyl-L-alanyl-D-glutamate--2,6-diaminopimelate ligase [Actinomycetota bacterium]